MKGDTGILLPLFPFPLFYPRRNLEGERERGRKKKHIPFVFPMKLQVSVEWQEKKLEEKRGVRPSSSPSGEKGGSKKELFFPRF